MGSLGPLGVAHMKDFLHYPAVVLLEGHLVGLGGVDADEVGVVLVPLPVTDALEEDLDEAEASGDRVEMVFRTLVHAPAHPILAALLAVRGTYWEPKCVYTKASGSPSAAIMDSSCLQGT